MSESEFPAELVKRCQAEVNSLHADCHYSDVIYAVLREAMPGYAAMVSALEEARLCVFENTWRASSRLVLLTRIDAALKAAGNGR